MPSPGFQALILCGPGVSLNTFTSNPKDFPKALVPIANRPMVWYPLEWCYRMGVTNIVLVTPPESAAAIEAALGQNPHLTSLPAPKPDIVAPEGLTQTSGTAEIFRFPEVQKVITGDFIVLPCDIVCELDGASLLQTWMIEEAGLGGATGGRSESGPLKMGPGGEKTGRRGGLAVWYPTKREDAIKGEETDFLATTELADPIVIPPKDSLRPYVSNVVYSIPTDTMKDIFDEHKAFLVRHALLKKHGKTRMLNSPRNAHIFFLPYWVLDMIIKNEKFDSVSEDVLGWWAKAGWQKGLGERLGLRDILLPSEGSMEDSMNDFDDELNVGNMTSTRPSTVQDDESVDGAGADFFASRVSDAKPIVTERQLDIPPLLAYVQPSNPTAPFIRRVDTVPLLLNVSLRLAKLPSVDEVGADAASPFAHKSKIAHPDSVPKRSTVTAVDSLLAENVTVEEKANVKESVVGPNCHIGSGARLVRCILMEGAVVGENCQLSGCVLGRRCKIEGGTVGKGDEERTNLRDCEVQDGYLVPWGTDEKNNKFMVFEGLSDEGEPDMDFDDDGNGNDGFDVDDEGISER